MNHVNGTLPIPPQGGINTPDCDLFPNSSLSFPALSSQVCTSIFNKSLSLSCICLTLELVLAWTQEPSHRCSELSPFLDIPVSLQQRHYLQRAPTISVGPVFNKQKFTKRCFKFSVKAARTIEWKIAPC